MTDANLSRIITASRPLVLRILNHYLSAHKPGSDFLGFFFFKCGDWSLVCFVSMDEMKSTVDSILLKNSLLNT